jgi:hypothetical protein
MTLAKQHSGKISNDNFKTERRKFYKILQIMCHDKDKTEKVRISDYMKSKNFAFIGKEIIHKNLFDFYLSPGLLNRFSSMLFYLDW